MCYFIKNFNSSLAYKTQSNVRANSDFQVIARIFFLQNIKKFME